MAFNYKTFYEALRAHIESYGFVEVPAKQYQNFLLNHTPDSLRNKGFTIQFDGQEEGESAQLDGLKINVIFSLKTESNWYLDYMADAVQSIGALAPLKGFAGTELMTNFDFSSGLTGWLEERANLSESGGICTVQAESDSDCFAYQAIGESKDTVNVEVVVKSGDSYPPVLAVGTSLADSRRVEGVINSAIWQTLNLNNTPIAAGEQIMIGMQTPDTGEIIQVDSLSAIYGQADFYSTTVLRDFSPNYDEDFLMLNFNNIIFQIYQKDIY